MPAKTTTRRELLNSATALFTTQLFTGNLRGVNDRLNFGLIGTGGRGGNYLDLINQHPQISVVALCDVHKTRLDQALAETHASGHTAAKGYGDFREVLEKGDVDAVVVATPDHWHPYITIEACKKGKDVLVEKPISIFPKDDAAMRAAAVKYNRIVQVGTQQRSTKLFQIGREIIRSGILGKVIRVETRLDGDESIGNPPDGPAPAELDWKMWLGPAPWHDYNPNRFDQGRFRYFWDYAGGKATDWGAHLLDIVLWYLEPKGPYMISAMGSEWFDDNRETPGNLTITYGFSDGLICTFVHTPAENSQSVTRVLDSRGRGHVIALEMERGKFNVNRYGWMTTLRANDDLKQYDVNGQTYPLDGESKVYDPDDPTRTHLENFLQCIHSRQKPASDIANHFSTEMGNLGNISYRTLEQLVWDPENSRLIDFESVSNAARNLLYTYPSGNKNGWELNF